MENNQLKTMRDVFIERVGERMKEDDSIFFLSADFGASALDKLRKDFKDRFINVGIAEQNLINVSAGLALEGYNVFAYAIAPFITMRAYEQIRQNLSISSQMKPINVNIIGVGTGVSYELSGPSHHCLEDISLMRTLPNFIIFSPPDRVLCREFVDYSIGLKMPKYLRFDAKPLPQIYEKIKDFSLDRGFYELVRGKKVCLVATGFMTHRALEVSANLPDVGVLDIFILKPIDENSLFDALGKYEYIVTVEEAFVDAGGLSSLVSKIIRDHQLNIKIKSLGMKNEHIFEVGDRNYLHQLNNLDKEGIIKMVKNLN